MENPVKASVNFSGAVIRIDENGLATLEVNGKSQPFSALNIYAWDGESCDLSFSVPEKDPKPGTLATHKNLRLIPPTPERAVASLADEDRPEVRSRLWNSESMLERMKQI